MKTIEEKAADLIFAATSVNASGGSLELVITDADDVFLQTQEGQGGRIITDELEKSRRDIDEYLRKVERLGVAEWDPLYGADDASAPGGWHVIIEVRGRLYRSRGQGEHPEEWEQFCTLFEEFTGVPFGE